MDARKGALLVHGGGVQRSQQDGLFRQGLLLASVGIEMAAAVAIGYFVGDRLDRLFGTAPYLMWIFLGCGVAAAFLGLYRLARKFWPKD